MERRTILVSMLALVALAGCGGGPAPTAPQQILPEAVGEARRGEIQPVAVIPDDLRPLGVEAAWQTTFQEAGRPFEVTLYRMKTATSAFAAMQRWRVEPGLTAFHKGRSFVVIRDGEQKDLVGFAGALHDAMPEV